jgi:hypothetical protein
MMILGCSLKKCLPAKNVTTLFRRFSLSVLFLLLLWRGNIVLADESLSGYASIVAGRTSNGSQFLADYPKAGIYDDEWSFSPDTSIGVQLNKSINNNLNLVVQAISNGASDYDVDLDWAYINYQLSPYLSLQAGRKRLPLYYYSDFFDLGHAYYWVRPPTDNYTWQIANYNGLSLQYQPYLGSWDALINLYAGREDSRSNDLLGLLYGARVDETWKNMVGIVVELSQNWIELRGTFMQGQLDRTVNHISTDENVRQEFSGVSVNFYLDKFIILSEFNQYETPTNDIHVNTSMISFGYQLGDFTPHVTHSSFKQKQNTAGGDEDHNTSSIGLRWDFDKATALKIQYDKVKDNGVTIPILGDSESLSLGVDVVF